MGYSCPFCRNIASGDADHPLEILHRYEHVFVKMNPRWPRNNSGAALVIPNEHYENVYEVPVALGEPLQWAIRDTANAMKRAFGCDGINVWQNNEPASGQTVWHYHVHVVPRYGGDDFPGDEFTPAALAEMRRLADQLRAEWPGEDL